MSTPRTGPRLLGVVVGTVIFAAVVGGGLGAVWAPLTWLWVPTMIVVGALGLVAWWAGLHAEAPVPIVPARREPRASDLASDAQRENVARQLREAHAVGRLDADELEARAARAYRARTVGQLAALIDDVP